MTKLFPPVGKPPRKITTSLRGRTGNTDLGAVTIRPRREGVTKVLKGVTIKPKRAGVAEIPLRVITMP